MLQDHFEPFCNQSAVLNMSAIPLYMSKLFHSTDCTNTAINKLKYKNSDNIQLRYLESGLLRRGLSSLDQTVFREQCLVGPIFSISLL